MGAGALFAGCSNSRTTNEPWGGPPHPAPAPSPKGRYMAGITAKLVVRKLTKDLPS